MDMPFLLEEPEVTDPESPSFVRSAGMLLDPDKVDSRMMRSRSAFTSSTVSAGEAQTRQAIEKPISTRFHTVGSEGTAATATKHRRTKTFLLKEFMSDLGGGISLTAAPELCKFTTTDTSRTNNRDFQSATAQRNILQARIT